MDGETIRKGVARKIAVCEMVGGNEERTSIDRSVLKWMDLLEDKRGMGGC